MPSPTTAALLLSSLLAVSPATAHPGAARTPSETTEVVFQPELPSSRPDTFELRLPLSDQLAQVELQRRSLRGPSFRVRLHDGSGMTTITPPVTAVYSGWLTDPPGTLVVGHLSAAGFRGEVLQPGAPELVIEPLDDGRHRLSRSVGPHVVDDGGVQPDGRALMGQPSRSKGAGCTLARAQIAFDVDFPYFSDQGMSVPDTVANVEMHLLAVDEHHARDVLITYELVDIVIRTAPFYFPDANNSLLGLFRDEWRLNQTTVERDVAHLMTGQPQGAAGLAYVGTICDDNWHYGWSRDASTTLGHELGHSWGASHCHDGNPCNNMCGSCLYIGPNTQAIIEVFRDGLSCLDRVGGHATPQPPRARLDHVTLTQALAASHPTVDVDVLANDHDSNCDPLSIDSFDPASERGGSVILSIGTGLGGCDALRYTPPCSSFSGTDRFRVVVGDGTGATAVSEVVIDVLDAGTRAHWPLDGILATPADDLTGWQRHGTPEGLPTWSTGVLDGCVVLDGVDDHVTIPALELNGQFVSITGWIRRDGDQPTWAGLLMSRGESTQAGLAFATGNELTYSWNDDPNSYFASSGLIVPDATWTFVALVVEPQQATLFMDPGTGLVSSINVHAHVRQTFAGTGSLGWDPDDDSYRFRGEMDDWRVHDRALDQAELEQLVRTTGPAAAPSPADGSIVRGADVTLSWHSAADVDSHDVYFGIGFDAVRLADTASPEYRGNATDANWIAPGRLVSGVTYAWRVDDRRGPDVITGDTWLFEVEDLDEELSSYWRLDDATGTTATDIAGMADGMLIGDPTWVPGRFGSALEFDGDDAVSLPPLNATRIERTFTAWVRRQGPQVPRAGIIFSEDAGTVAGLRLLRDELRYRWGGILWSSGLTVLDGAWVLVALVIEPDRGTVYLHDGATLSSSENVFPHEFQSFAGQTFLGLFVDSNSYFRGELDDVRVYESALSSDAIERLATAPGRAVEPRPVVGATLRLPPADLSWVAGPGATARDVYFGSGYQAVDAADPTSPEYRGRRMDPTWPLPPDVRPGIYYWRVDEVVGPTIVEGEVWHWALLPRTDDSLRVTKAAGGEPVLRWPALGGGTLIDIQRCEPSAQWPCLPAGIASAGPGVGSYLDAGAVQSVHWYSIVASGDCVP